MKFSRNIGVILLAIYLFMHALALIGGPPFAGYNTILGGMAIAAGVFLLLER